MIQIVTQSSSVWIFEQEGWVDISEEFSSRTTLINSRTGALVIFANASFITDKVN